MAALRVAADLVADEPHCGGVTAAVEGCCRRQPFIADAAGLRWRSGAGAGGGSVKPVDTVERLSQARSAACSGECFESGESGFQVVDPLRWCAMVRQGAAGLGAPQGVGQDGA